MVKEAFAELFVHMECASAYDGKLAGELVAVISGDKYWLRETLTSIGLYGDGTPSSSGQESLLCATL